MLNSSRKNRSRFFHVKLSMKFTSIHEREISLISSEYGISTRAPASPVIVLGTRLAQSQYKNSLSYGILQTPLRARQFNQITLSHISLFFCRIYFVYSCVLQVLAGEISPFMCSGSHLVQLDTFPSSVHTILEGVSKCNPSVPIRPCILKVGSLVDFFLTFFYLETTCSLG